MTYVILLDEFDTEGWLQTQTLFTPSFFSDQVKIYSSSAMDRALEIEDLIDRGSRHTFLFLSVQRELRADDTLLSIRRYRYKTIFERIKKEFVYCKEHLNVLLIIDRIPHERSSGEYVDRHKSLAIELDKQGFVEDNSLYPYLISRNEFMMLYSEVVTIVHREDDIDNARKQSLLLTLEPLLESHLLKRFEAMEHREELEQYIKNIKLLKEQFLQDFVGLDLSSFDLREHILLTMMQGLFAEIIGIHTSLQQITLVNYAPDDIYLDDGEMNITIASLISLISNRQEHLFKQGWFEIDTLETDRSYLAQSLANLVALDLPERPENKKAVTLHDLEQIVLDVPPPTQDDIKSLDDIPYVYYRKRELELINEVEEAYSMISAEIYRVKDALVKSKEEIYLHPGAPVSVTLNIEQLEVRSKEVIIPVHDKQHEPSILFEKEFQQLRMQEFKEKLRNSYRKLPRTWLSAWMISIILLITLVPTVLSYHDRLENVFSLANILIIVTLVLISFWFYGLLRATLTSKIRNYRRRLRGIQMGLYKWFEDSVVQYQLVFRTKLMFENRERCRNVFREIQEDEKQWMLHQNKIKTLKKQAKEIMRSCHFDTESNSSFLKRSDIELDTTRVLAYSLFPHKKKVSEVIIDQKMSTNAIECYGFITKLKLSRFEMGE